jgi:hypothetical protein
MAKSWQKKGVALSSHDLDQCGRSKNIATQPKCLHFYKTKINDTYVHCFSSASGFGMIGKTF